MTIRYLDGRTFSQGRAFGSEPVTSTSRSILPVISPSRTQPNNHFENFIEAVRAGKPDAVNAGVEDGAITAGLIHLANISYRLRRSIRFDPTTFTCPGDPEATAMCGPRAYRAPYVVPKLV